jgi:hypothetical protein
MPKHNVARQMQNWDLLKEYNAIRKGTPSSKSWTPLAKKQIAQEVAVRKQMGSLSKSAGKSKHQKGIFDI